MTFDGMKFTGFLERFIAVQMPKLVVGKVMMADVNSERELYSTIKASSKLLNRSIILIVFAVASRR